MNRMLKMFCCLLGLALAAVAFSASAGNDKKMFSLVMSSPVVQIPPPYTVQATVKNEGNSTISSFKLSYSGGLTIVGVQQPGNGTASFTANSVTVTKMPYPLNPGQSLTVTIGMSSCNSDNPGAWSASVWNGAQLNGQSFSLVVADSTLATAVSCGSAAPGAAINVVDANNPASCFMGQRGFYDQDGGVRAGVQYFVTNNLFTISDTLHFKWPDDNSGDPFAAFEYDVCAPDPIPPAGTTQVAWLNTNGGSASTGTPVFVPAQPCNDYANFLPAPYGTLVNSVPAANEGDVSVITVNALSQLGPFGGQGPFDPLQPNGTIKHPAVGCVAHNVVGTAQHFDVVIGNERMRVTDACSDDDPGGDLSDPADLAGEGEPELETWTVTRGVGRTPTGGQNANALVMSTPKPLLPGPGEYFQNTAMMVPHPYTPGAPALMCIAVPATEEGGGVHATTLLDVGGDGHVTGP